jgi:hypothetical protein
MAAKKAISKTIRVADWMTEGVLAVETFDSIAVARRLMAKHRPSGGYCDRSGHP